MPLSVSLAPDMLATIRGYLEAEILPALSDDKWFNVKVAINALATVERELRLGPKANAEEAERLTALLGKTGSLEELNRALARALRDGSLSIEDARVLDHLRRTTADALAINNPQWPAR